MYYCGRCKTKNSPFVWVFTVKLPEPCYEICDVPDALISGVLELIDEADWHVSDYRREAGNMESTNSIPIHHTPLCATCPTDEAIKSIRKELLYEKYAASIRPILELLGTKYKYNQYAAFISRLEPNASIGMHRDRGAYLETCRRIHVPLFTNPKVAYCIERKEYYWMRGKAYEFDNTRPHGVKNRSDEYRIHLVINLYDLPDDFINHTHNGEPEND